MKDINIVSLALYLMGSLLVLWHVTEGYSFGHWQGSTGFMILAIGYGIHKLLDGGRNAH